MAPRQTLQSPGRLLVGEFDARALGISVGIVLGCTLALCTLILVARGGDVVGPNLGLLSHYFIGYSVSLSGAFVGGTYAFVVGFSLAYSFAKIRTVLVRAALRWAWNREQRRASRDFLDHLT